MFEIGERIVYINTIKKYYFDLIIGKTYIVMSIGLDFVSLKDQFANGFWDIGDFITEIEYQRRSKIIKLKERICSETIIN